MPDQPRPLPRARASTLLVANRAALAQAPKLGDPSPDLRGTLPREPTEPPRLRYFADLTDPAVRPFMISRADPEGRTAYIDEYPASNLGVRTTPAELKAGILKMMAGGPLDRGPRVTFENDQAGAPSPRQPLTPDAAGMAAAAVVDSGLRSVNINSTTGGHAGNPRSAHNRGGAVDINRVNGLRVGFQLKDGSHVRNTDPAAMAGVSALQDAYLRQPGVFEDYGPDYLLRMPGRTPVTRPALVDMHQNHIHASTAKPGR